MILAFREGLQEQKEGLVGSESPGSWLENPLARKVISSEATDSTTLGPSPHPQPSPDVTTQFRHSRWGLGCPTDTESCGLARIPGKALNVPLGHSCEMNK